MSSFAQPRDRGCGREFGRSFEQVKEELGSITWVVVDGLRVKINRK